MIWAMSMDPARPTEYAREVNQKSQSSKLDASRVTTGRVPDRFTMRPIMSMDGYKPLVSALQAYVRGRNFPETLFGPNGAITKTRDLAKYEANTAAPSGESGVSHYMKTAIFDPLNHLLRLQHRDHDGPDDPERVWSVIEIEATGKSDWGLKVGGVLVVVVEIKPHQVSLARPPPDQQH